MIVLYKLIFNLLIYLPISPVSFTPFDEPYFRLVQGISFGPDSAMYFTLPHKDYLEATGQHTDVNSPRLALYRSKKSFSNWSLPELLPFSGAYNDYEPTISPDGQTLFFNSVRPIEGKEVLSKNNIWYSIYQNNQWQPPQLLLENVSAALEQSYASISKAGDLIYMGETINNGRSKYDLFLTNFTGDAISLGLKIDLLTPYSDKGDPLISPDGSFLIFTSYNHNDWAATCDLYITYRDETGWGLPTALVDLNSTGPDFAPALSADGQWLYYRKNYNYMKVNLSEVLDKTPKFRKR